MRDSSLILSSWLDLLQKLTRGFSPSLFVEKSLVLTGSELKRDPPQGRNTLQAVPGARGMREESPSLAISCLK